MIKLKQLASEAKLKHIKMTEWPVAVVFGGDGSYMKVLKTFALNGIELDFISACFLPFGTGNDLPRQMGWGGDSKQAFTKSLESIIRELHLKGSNKRLDIWEVDVKEQEEKGAVYYIDSLT